MGGTVTAVLLEVGFDAGRGGTFPMTWGQQTIWKPIKWYGDAADYFNIKLVLDVPEAPVPPGQDAVLGVLRQLVERHQALRTHYSDDSGGPRQHVAESGTFTVRVADGPAGGSRARADALAAELGSSAFRHSGEWPARIALVTANGRPRHVVLVVSHLAADGAGAQALVADFTALLAAPPPPPADGIWQPADQVLREQSKRGQRRNSAAVAHWRKLLEHMPPSMFDFPPVPAAQPRFHRLRLDSRAAAAAAARLAVDGQISVPSAVLTATALALAAVSGRDTSVLQLIAGNRYDGQVRTMVAPMSQNGLFAVTYPEESIAQAARRTHQAARAGYFYGHYEPAAVAALCAEVAAQRGVSFDLTAYFNDLTALYGHPDGPQGDPLPESGARRLLAGSALVPDGTWVTQDSKFFLEAECGPQLCRLHLLADTAYLPLPAMETVLRGIETILLEGAYAGATVAAIPTLTGIKAATRDGG